MIAVSVLAMIAYGISIPFPVDSPPDLILTLLTYHLEGFVVHIYVYTKAYPRIKRAFNKSRSTLSRPLSIHSNHRQSIHSHSAAATAATQNVDGGEAAVV